ncbi:MAG: right-handed parallel beta-helix repeat-containing protein [Chloroflexota bacterium]
MPRRTIFIVVLFLFSLSFILIPAQSTLAATLNAGTLDELISKISIANGTAGADTIVLTSDITLTALVDTGLGNSGLPIIVSGSDITIEGQGHTLTRDVNAPAFRILRVAAGGNLTLLNLVVSNGDVLSGSGSGGGMYNAGTLTIINSTFSGNKADLGGAVYSTGTLLIINSTFSGNTGQSAGGGVLNAGGGTMDIHNSVFFGNTASFGNGGAIQNEANATLNSSSIFDNDAFFNGGAVYNYTTGTMTINSSSFYANSTGSLGGAMLSFGTLNLRNSTVSDNTAGNKGGAVYNGFNGTATIINSTISGNSAATSGGGVQSINTSPTITNTIVTNNIITDSLTVGNCSGWTMVGSYSLDNDGSCTNFVNSPTINLASLADNGGPTQTIALNAGSSALDTANATPCTTAPILGFDQRGVLRGIDANGTPNNPVTGDCDIGALESGGAIRTVQFADTNSTITPGSMTAIPVRLTLDAPLTAGYAPISAYIWISSGTAIAGRDYALFGFQSVVFHPGDQTKTLTLTLLNAPLTADRNVVLSFATTSSPGFSGPARLGTQLSHTITLKASTSTAAPVRYYYGTRNVTLTWIGVSWASGYEIQVDNEPSFATPRIAESTSIPVDSLSYPVTVPGNGTYYWRVLAKNADGTPGTYSPTESFVVAGT